MGLGVGLLIGGLIMMSSPNNELTNFDIEKRARNMGMVYPSELRITDFYEEGKND